MLPEWTIPAVMLLVIVAEVVFLVVTRNPK